MLSQLLLISERPFEKRRPYEALIWASFLLVAVQGLYYIPVDRVEYGLHYAIVLYCVTVGAPFVNALAVSRMRSRLAAYLFVGSLSLTVIIASARLVAALDQSLPFVLGICATVLDCFAAMYIVNWLRGARKKWVR